MLKTIEIMQQYIPTIAQGGMERYEQAIADARTWIVETLLCREFMTEIEAMSPESELYRNVERIMAYKSYGLAIPKLDLVETANGFAVVNDEKLLPASRDRVNALLSAMETSCVQAVSELLNYLEDTPKYREAWSKSPAFTVMTDSFLPTIRQFRRYGQFAGGHLDFIAARPAVQAVIIRYIEPRISRELAQEIIREVAEDALTQSSRRIIDDLRFALASFYNDNAEFGEMSVARVRRQLEAAPDAFPAFKNSELYRQITAPEQETPKSSFYIL